MTFVPDKREAILTQLEVVFKGLLPNSKFFFRNTTSIPESARPAIILLDGDESTDDSAFGRKRPATGTVIVAMTPEIYVLLEQRKDDPAGPAINAFRKAIIKAVLTDATLVALCHDGDIRYQGIVTGFAAGRSLEAEAGFSFTFNYALMPSKL